jgi:hypothetical protein
MIVPRYETLAPPGLAVAGGLTAMALPAGIRSAEVGVSGKRRLALLAALEVTVLGEVAEVLD